MDKRMIKRTKRVRSKVVGVKDRPRLTVYRSNKSISGQIIDDSLGKTIAVFSSDKLKAADRKGKSKTEVALAAGQFLAEDAKKKKVTQVVFDRGGYKYHGRVKAFADGARKGGLKF